MRCRSGIRGLRASAVIARVQDWWQGEPAVADRGSPSDPVRRREGALRIVLLLLPSECPRMARRTIEERRVSLGWSMAKLARRAQVSYSRVRRACAGDVTAADGRKIEAALTTEERGVRVTYKGRHPTLRDLALHIEGKRHSHGSILVRRPPTRTGR